MLQPFPLIIRRRKVQNDPQIAITRMGRRTAGELGSWLIESEGASIDFFITFFLFSFLFFASLLAVHVSIFLFLNYRHVSV
jgi:hypothetical protein